jgi:hypothetical protein
MEEYSYLSGRVPEADGMRGHQRRVHEILLDIIVCTDYDLKEYLSRGSRLAKMHHRV